MEHRLFDDNIKPSSEKSAELLGDLLQTKSSTALSSSSLPQQAHDIANTDEECVFDDGSPFRADSDVVFDSATLAEKMQSLTAEVRPFKSKAKVGGDATTTSDITAPNVDVTRKKEKKRGSWGIFSSRGKDENEEGEGKPETESLKQDEGIDVGPLDEELRISKADCEKYKRLYEEAVQKIDVLEDMVRRLEFKLSMKDAGKVEAGDHELETTVVNDNDAISMKKSSQTDIDPEWLRLQEEERARKAKLKAKKLADARKKKGGKRATPRQQQQQRQQQEPKGATIAPNSKSLDDITSCSVLEQRLPDVPVTKKSEEPTKISSSSKDLWDDDDDDDDDDEQEYFTIAKESTNLQTRRDSVEVDWDSSGDETDKKRGTSHFNEDDWSFDDDNDDEVEWDDDEVEWDNDEGDDKMKNESSSLPSGNNNASGVDDLSKTASLEAAIENNIMTWARGKHIVNLLNSVRTVYHGYVGDLGNEWIIGYANGSLTPSQIRKAYISTVRYCHPDKQSNDATELIKLQAKKVFSVLSEAYNIYKESV